MDSQNNISSALKSVFTGDAILKYSKKNSALLFILPLIYGALAWLYYYQTVYFYTTYTDPTYIYLVNGINIASGHFDLGHYDNPGTTAHWLAGIVFFFTHLFWGKGNIIEDIINRPEFYLRADAVVCVVLIVLSVYFAGRLIAKNTGNYITAFFFQLIIISSCLNVGFMARVCPEYLMVLIMPYYCAYIWMLSYKKSFVEGFSISTKSILFLAFITAALFVAKITCVPFIVVPFFFIDKIKKIVLYITSTLVFAALILFPVWNNLGNMYKWFVSLATHSGIYGKGKEQIIDKAEYVNSLKMLLNEQWFFTLGVILASVFVVAGLFTKKWKNSFYKLTLAFWIVIVAQIIVVAKHYNYHYLIPAQALTIPAVLAGFVTFSNFKLNKGFVVGVLLASAGFLLYTFTTWATTYWNGNNEYKSSVAVAKQFGNMPKIMTTGFEESPFVESSLGFGLAYGGDGFGYGRDYTRKKYATSFVFDKATDKVTLFWKPVLSSDLFEEYPEILVNISKSDQPNKQTLLNKITADYKYAIKNIELARHDYATGEDFYVIHTDTALAKPHGTQTLTINFDFEKTTDNKSNFLSSDGLTTCDGVKNASKEKFTSGTTSLKTSLQNRYVGWATFAAEAGDAVDITVKTHPDDNAGGGIILGSVNNKSFEAIGEKSVADLGNGWKKIRIKTRMPNKFEGHQAGICFFYFGDGVCYFDDLSIKVIKK